MSHPTTIALLKTMFATALLQGGAAIIDALITVTMAEQAPLETRQELREHLIKMRASLAGSRSAYDQMPERLPECPEVGDLAIKLSAEYKWLEDQITAIVDRTPLP